MSNLVRRLAPRSLTPTRGEGPPAEAEQLGDPVATDDDRLSGFDVEPGGKVVPRFKRFAAEISPPPPSPQYKADARYVAHVDIHPDTRRRAIANHQRWHNRHSDATNEVCAWLASQGLLGVEAKTAKAAQARSDESRRQAREAVAAAQAALVQAKDRLAEAAVSYLETGTGRLPTGVEVIASRQATEGAELAAEAIEQACRQAHQRWGLVLNRVDWPSTLKAAEQLKGADAELATVWLRAKVRPPASPTVDPLGWI